MPLQSSSFDPRARCRSAKAEKRHDNAISFPLFLLRNIYFLTIIVFHALASRSEVFFSPSRQHFVQNLGDFLPAEQSDAMTVLAIGMAIVVGQTPPGTGVMAAMSSEVSA